MNSSHEAWRQALDRGDEFAAAEARWLHDLTWRVLCINTFNCEWLNRNYAAYERAFQHPEDPLAVDLLPNLDPIPPCPESCCDRDIAYEYRPDGLVILPNKTSDSPAASDPSLRPEQRSPSSQGRSSKPGR